MPEFSDVGLVPITWQRALADAIRGFVDLPTIAADIGAHHVADTPARVAKALAEMTSGHWTDPVEFLARSFEEQSYSEMIYVNSIEFSSLCAHHLLPFFGRVHFAYIPDGKIVGLSKIPRLVDILTRRLQVQEKLTDDIATIFSNVIAPKGCGVVVEAYHLCMMLRGVRKEKPFTKTTALRGCFLNSSSKSEFLAGIPQGGQIWP